MRLLSRGVRHLVLMIAVTGTASASDEPSSAASLELVRGDAQGEILRPMVMTFVIGRHFRKGRRFH